MGDSKHTLHKFFDGESPKHSIYLSKRSIQPDKSNESKGFQLMSLIAPRSVFAPPSAAEAVVEAESEAVVEAVVEAEAIVEAESEAVAVAEAEAEATEAVGPGG